jgi:flavin reductase (DIM6/NTAB) family NADH-FMN oxidoreductase RutF
VGYFFWAKETPKVTIKLRARAYVDECSMGMECRLRETVDLGSHVMVIGEILDVKVDEEALTDGAPDIQLLKPFIYSPGDNGYHSLGVRIGDALAQKTPPG